MTKDQPPSRRTKAERENELVALVAKINIGQWAHEGTDR